MTPLDDELRALLSSRADAQPPSPDPLAGIEARAARIHRGRVVRAVAGTALAVALVGVGVPLALDRPDVAGAGLASTGGPETPGAVTPGPATPAPGTAGPATSGPSAPPLADAAFALDPVDPWPFRGDAAQLSALPAVTAAVEHAHGAGWDVTPLWAQYYDPSGTPTLVWLATRGQDARWGVSQGDDGSGVVLRHDEALAPGTTALMAALPGDEVGRLLVLGSPRTAMLRYGSLLEGAAAGDGVGRVMDQSTAKGVGLAPLEQDTADDRVEVYRKRGANDPSRECMAERTPEVCPLVLVFAGPAPDPEAAGGETPAPAVSPAPAPSGTPPAAVPPGPQPSAPAVTAVAPPPPPAGAPTNLLGWPHRGVPGSGPATKDLGSTLGKALGGDEPASYRVLLEGTDDADRAYAVGQAWLPGERAHSFSYSLRPAADPEVFVGPVTPPGTRVLAFVLSSPTPGKGDDTLVVVPAPGATQVRYAGDDGTYRVVGAGQEQLGGAVLVDRDPRAASDRLRVLFGNGPRVDTPVFPLLCGLVECG